MVSFAVFAAIRGAVRQRIAVSAAFSGDFTTEATEYTENMSGRVAVFAAIREGRGRLMHEQAPGMNAEANLGVVGGSLIEEAA